MIVLTNVKKNKSIGICAPSDLSDTDSIVLALGMFDGVHMGHRLLFQKTVELADELSSTPSMLTFEHHPSNIIESREKTPILSTVREKAQLAADCGIRQMILMSFDEDMRDMEAEDFINTSILSMNVAAVVCGYNYRFGKNAKGDHKLLSDILGKKGITVAVVDECRLNDVTVNSTLIRRIIQSGDVKDAARYLCHPYTIGASVAHGYQRGTKLGFPTANMVPSEEKCLPPNGVYASVTYVDGTGYPSVTNIGTNPTYNNASTTVETNIFDFDCDIYDQYITVCLIEQIRGEKRFSSPEELKKQVDADILTAREISRSYKNM